jgi:hypothetical protein
MQNARARTGAEIRRRYMKGRFRVALAASALALHAAAGSAAAFAQPAPPEGGRPMAHGPGGPMMGRRDADPAERAAKLRDLLQLKPAQEPALQAYVQALGSARQGMTPPESAEAWPKTTPERLARMKQMMAQHQSAMTAMMDATRRFYDQLDPAQKRAFDTMPMMMGPGMGPMGGGMGSRHGPGGPGMAPPPPPPP